MSWPTARRRPRGTDRSPAPAGPRDPAGVAALVEAGWTLPPALVADRPPVVTRLGVADSPWTAWVDGRGAVSPTPGWFSLDWAVGAEDRWHVPARDGTVTQSRLGHAPVVETRLRVPGGHVVHRAYASRGSRFPGGDEWVVVEVENTSAVPVALAWLVRPWTPAGVGQVPSIHLAPAGVARAGEGGTPPGPWQLWVGEVAAVLPRRPSRWAAGAGDDGGPDPLAAVVAGTASADWAGVGERWPADAPSSVAASATWGARDGVWVDSDAGLASLALLVPLPHTAVARILLPRGVWPPHRDAEVGWPAAVPEADQVVAGWRLHAERGPRVELPDPVLAEAVAAARRSLPLAHRVARRPAASDDAPPPAVHRIDTGASPPGHAVADRMEVVAALAWWGDAAALDPLLATWPAGQQRGGGFGSPGATAAALRALAAATVASGDPGPARAWLPELSGAIEHLGRAVPRGSRWRRRAEPDPDAARAVADGLEAGSVLLAALGQAEAAARVAADAGRAAGEAGGPGDGRAGRPVDGSGATPRLLAAAAVGAARAGRPSEALWALLRRASATWTWPEPDRWVGDDLLVPARLLTAVAHLLVDDRPPGPALLPWLPPAWWGQGCEVHGAPTRWGRLSYAVRWHGDRPAVLWELASGGDEGPGGGVGPSGPSGPVLSAPGLDPDWSSRDRAGEALLAPVAPPPEGRAGAGPGGEGRDVEAIGPSVRAAAAPPRSVWRPTDPGPDSPDPHGGDAASGSPPPPAPEGGSFS